MLHVCLGGGGSAEDEAALIEHFCSSLRGAHPVLYIPWANLHPGDPRLAAWAKETLAQHGVTDVVVAADIDAWSASEARAYDGFFVGGGNTYLLLSRLRETGLGSAITDGVGRGIPYYGGSAGGVVVGGHIGTCAHVDRNDVGIVDFRGLDLCEGAAVWPHYTPADDTLIRSFRSTHQMPVIALGENAGACVGSHGLLAFGGGEACRWSGVEKEPLPRALA